MAGYPLNHWDLPGALSSRISLYFLLSSLLFVCIYIYDAVLRRIPHITTAFDRQMEIFGQMEQQRPLKHAAPQQLRLSRVRGS